MRTFCKKFVSLLNSGVFSSFWAAIEESTLDTVDLFTLIFCMLIGKAAAFF